MSEPKVRPRLVTPEEIGWRQCLCGDRWYLWADGYRAGDDRVVGTADDLLMPELLTNWAGDQPDS